MENLLIPYQAVKKIPAKHILVLAPHPDDEVFGCGGAIMRHVEQQDTIHVIIATNGAYGANQEKNIDYIQQRQNESIAAAKILGYGEPVFWQYQDRQLAYGEQLITDILQAINDTHADLIYAPSVYEIHPDHRALGMAAVEAVRRSKIVLQLALYEVGLPLRPNLLLDISSLASRKLEAMGCFTSQNVKQRYDLDIAALNRYRTYTLPAEVTAAEAYILTSSTDLANDSLKLYQSEYSRQHQSGLPLDSQDLPLISVIIRSMDRPTLSDALDSVALQTYPNIEVVIINAKGDTHRALPEWCGRFPIHFVSSEASLNRSTAANLGLKTAQGEYLIFLDDDDWFLPHHINRLKIALDQSNTAIAAYAAIQCIDEQGNEVNCYAQPFNPIQLRIENYIPIHALLFRRTVLTHHVCFDEALDFCEDWDFWLQLLPYGEFCYAPEVGAVYRTIEGQGSGIREQHERTQQAMLHIYKKWLPRWNDETIWCIFEYARHKQKSDAQQLEITHLRKEVAGLNAHISKFMRSTSWRITHPLRMFKQFLNKLR